MGVFRQLVAGILAKWGRLPLAERYRITAVAVTVPLALLVMAGTAPASDKMTRLVTCKTRLDALGVQRLLEAKHIAFEVRDNGQTILVPADLRAELILELTQTARWRPVFSETAMPAPGGSGVSRSR